VPSASAARAKEPRLATLMKAMNWRSEGYIGRLEQSFY
jgi:hypothetical protein